MSTDAPMLLSHAFASLPHPKHNLSLTHTHTLKHTQHIMVNLKFAYPCTIAWMGLATTTLASLTALHAARLLPRHLRMELGFAPQPGSSSSSSSSSSGSSSSSSGALAGLSALSAGVGVGSGAGGGGWGLLGVGRGVSGRYYLTRVLPTGFFMALTFTTGNMGYLYLTVAFVQMLKVGACGVGGRVRGFGGRVGWVGDVYCICGAEGLQGWGQGLLSQKLN